VRKVQECFSSQAKERSDFRRDFDPVLIATSMKVSGMDQGQDVSEGQVDHSLVLFREFTKRSGGREPAQFAEGEAHGARAQLVQDGSERHGHIDILAGQTANVLADPLGKFGDDGAQADLQGIGGPYFGRGGGRRGGCVPPWGGRRRRFRRHGRDRGPSR
jgi:hypothetical protein